MSGTYKNSMCTALRTSNYLESFVLEKKIRLCLEYQHESCIIFIPALCSVKGVYILSCQYSRHFNCEKNKNCFGLIKMIIAAKKKRNK